jgi:hypothetical protein
MQIVEDLRNLRRYLGACNVVRDYESQSALDRYTIQHDTVEAMIDVIVFKPQSRLMQLLFC